MHVETLEKTRAQGSWCVIHPLTPGDSAAMTALRSAVAGMKGKLEGTAAREPFNGVMERVATPGGVHLLRPTRLEAYLGWWARSAQAREGAAILHLHGGWFSWGNAQAFRNLVGHIALTAGVDAFIPDYRLAPEHPFPAAIRDAEACHRGLVDRGIKNIVLTGDSAGGNLALVLLSIFTEKAASGGILPDRHAHPAWRRPASAPPRLRRNLHHQER